eukprot:3557963-Pyramimonas_sp.AAC.1
MDDEDDVFAQHEHEEEYGPPGDLEPAEAPPELGPAQRELATLSLDFWTRLMTARSPWRDEPKHGLLPRANTVS